MTESIAPILAAEENRRAALVSLNMAELNRLFADDLVHIHSNAMTHNKAELLAHIEARAAFIDIERGPLTVRRFGDIAVMTGRMTNRMRANGATVVLSGMVTQILRLEAGEWRFINFQLTLGD